MAHVSTGESRGFSSPFEERLCHFQQREIYCVGFDEQVIAIYSPNNAKNGIKRGTDSVKGAAEQCSLETDTGRHCLSVAACVGPVVTQLLCYMTETM